MKKIAIIGANGYIARNLMFVLNRDYPECEEFLYGKEPNSIDGYTNYKTVDLVKRSDLKKIDLSCDVVFMFVGRTGSINGFDEYNSFIDINERTLLNLLDEYRRTGSKARIAFPSTRLVYKGKKGILNEEAEKEFKTVYAINKFACEQYLEQYHRVYDVNYSIFRICVPYGTLIPGASSYGTAEFMLNKAMNGDNIVLYGDGSARRTLTFMGDLCKTMIDGAFSEKCANDVFNIGGEDFSLREMAEMIASRFNVNVDYSPWPDVAMKIESGDTVFDSSKIDGVINTSVRNSFKAWVDAGII